MIDTNTSTNLNSTNFYQQASDTVAYGVNSVLSSATFAASKLHQLGQRYMTRAYLTEKVTDAAKAKMLPLSDPAGWNDKIEEARAKVARLTPIKLDAARKLKSLNYQIATCEDQTSNEKYLTPLKEKQTSIQKLYDAASSSLNAAHDEIDYLETQRKVQIGARFASYVGHGTNLIVPGAGIPSSLLITGASIMAQQNLVQNLSAKSTIAEKERYSVFCGTCATLACTITSLVFSVWCMPMIKDALNVKS